MNYTTLTALIYDTVEDESTEIVANIASIVKQAENRILYDLPRSAHQKSATASTTSSNRYLSLPSDCLAPLVVQIVSASSYDAIMPKDISFVREVYPLPSTTGQPKFYALFDNNSLLLGPTPDAAYTVEMSYFYKPESIVTASTTWVGDNAEALLFSACMVEANKFIKAAGAPGVIGAATWEEQYQKELMAMLKYFNLTLSGDDFRNNESRA